MTFVKRNIASQLTASFLDTAVKIICASSQARATPEKGDSQRVAKWPIVKYQSLVLNSFFRLSLMQHYFEKVSLLQFPIPPQPDEFPKNGITTSFCFAQGKSPFPQSQAKFAILVVSEKFAFFLHFHFYSYISKRRISPNRSSPLNFLQTAKVENG